MNDNSTQNPSLNKAMSVSELNRQAKRLLEVSLGQVWVSGEISSLSRPSSGHWYFSLKDDRAQVRCAMFKGFNQRLRFVPKEGDQIILRAKVSLYEGRGDYQLIVEGMEPAGLGQLQAAFEALKLKLSQEGLFDPKYKKAIPAIPQKVAVITSSTGAVIHDIISVTQRRFPALEIILLPVIVQGEGAAQAVASAIELANKHKIADVLIVGRGGGSLEDLWAFNEEIVARAIFNSELPIISAVGHEVDFTIADLVADYRAPTPSAAAEQVTPDQYELMQSFDQTQRRLSFLMNQQLEKLNTQVAHQSQRLKHPGDYVREKQLRLQELTARIQNKAQSNLFQAQERLHQTKTTLNAFKPSRQIIQATEHLEHLKNRLIHTQTNRLEQKQHRLALIANTLNTASPLSTLTRGYAITQNKKGKVITSFEDVRAGDTITTRLKEGSITSRVEASHPNDLFDQ